jgi:peroxiredoxin
MDPVISIGDKAPIFQLKDIKGQSHSLEEMRGKIIVLNFWSAECSWCERVDGEIITYMERWKDDVRVWWIATNANETQGLIEKVAAERKLPTLLLDPRQQVADRYGAQTTPHFFIVDKSGRLAYQGSWDDITFRQREATQAFVPDAIEALTHNLTPEVTQTAPYGCVLVRSFENN